MSGTGKYEWYPPVNYDPATSPYGPPIEETLACFADLPRGHILDVAGGYGRYAVPLAEAGHDVTILDINENDMAEARRRASELPEGSGEIHTERVDVVADSLDDLGEFDGMLCAGFLYLAPRHVVRAVFRSVTDRPLRGGSLVVVEFATNRVRRDAAGNSLMGEDEQNYTKRQGKLLLDRLYQEAGLAAPSLTDRVVHFEEPYYMHNDLVIASGVKS